MPVRQAKADLPKMGYSLDTWEDQDNLHHPSELWIPSMSDSIFIFSQSTEALHSCVQSNGFLKLGLKCSAGQEGEVGGEGNWELRVSNLLGELVQPCRVFTQLSVAQHPAGNMPPGQDLDSPMGKLPRNH